MAITVTLHGPSSNALLPRITPEALAAVINAALASLESEIAAGDATEASARATSEAALVSTAMDPVATASTLPAARALLQKLDDGSLSTTAFPLVGSASTGWYRHTSSADPVSGSTNTWALVVDGTERYRFFDTVLSCTLPPGDNWGITDGSRVFHIGNDGTGYYVVTTTDHMLRVGTHNGTGPGFNIGDQSAGGNSYTGRIATNPGFPFCVGTPDFSGASNGVSIQDGANSVIRVTNQSGGTTRTPQAFYRTGGTLVGSITTTDTTTSYVTTSDERLKTVVGPVSNSGDLIDALAPFWHTWNGSADTTRYLGMSAQAVAAQVPGVVVPGNDKEPGEAGFIPWQGDWTKLVPLLIAEVQALRVRVATLEAAP